MANKGWVYWLKLEHMKLKNVEDQHIRNALRLSVEKCIDFCFYVVNNCIIMFNSLCRWDYTVNG